MKRTIVRIEADKCTGCGLCIGACHEGALKLVNGKAQLVSESQCDGLGACLPACPADAIRIETREAAPFDEAAVPPTPAYHTSQKVVSQLRQWPIQLHLINPTAPCYQGADVLLTADCVAYALGGYHDRFLKGRALAIACPKLDEGQETYAAKIRAWIDEAQIKTLTVLIMQVPCCRGLFALAQQAAAQARRQVPVACAIVGLQGEIIEETN